MLDFVESKNIRFIFERICFSISQKSEMAIYINKKLNEEADKIENNISKRKKNILSYFPVLYLFEFTDKYFDGPYECYYIDYKNKDNYPYVYETKVPFPKHKMRVDFKWALYNKDNLVKIPKKIYNHHKFPFDSDFRRTSISRKYTYNYLYIVTTKSLLQGGNFVSWKKYYDIGSDEGTIHFGGKGFFNKGVTLISIIIVVSE
jgi:hypothetical protein